MIEVAKDVYVGDTWDYLQHAKGQEGWTTLHACKTYHKKFVGYKGNGCPKDNPEYLWAIRENELAINCIDVADPRFFNCDMISAAIGFIFSHTSEFKILIHCDQGRSRSAGIALLYLAVTNKIPNETFEKAESAFKLLYPPCDIGTGFRAHLMQNWDCYLCRDTNKEE